MKKKLLLLALHLAVLGCFAVCMLKFPEEIIDLKAEVRQKIISMRNARNSYDAFDPVSHNDEAWYQNNRLIYHAGGGVDGLTYTNSKEALAHTLQLGNRVIEMDFAYTSDGHLVCVRDWYDISGQHAPLSLADYRNLRVFGKYTPITAEELLGYMEEYEDLYIVVDTKEKDVNQVVLDLIDLCGKDSKLPDRFIIQLYGGGSKEVFRNAYPFADENFLFTVYKFGPDKPLEIMEICYRENITVITVPYGRMDPSALKAFIDRGFIVFEHTVNRPDDAQKSLQMGIHGLYTDFLSPADLNP